MIAICNLNHSLRIYMIKRCAVKISQKKKNVVQLKCSIMNQNIIKYKFIYFFLIRNISSFHQISQNDRKTRSQTYYTKCCRRKIKINHIHCIYEMVNNIYNEY